MARLIVCSSRCKRSPSTGSFGVGLPRVERSSTFRLKHPKVTDYRTSGSYSESDMHLLNLYQTTKYCTIT